MSQFKYRCFRLLNVTSHTQTLLYNAIDTTQSKSPIAPPAPPQLTHLEILQICLHHLSHPGCQQSSRPRFQHNIHRPGRQQNGHPRFRHNIHPRFRHNIRPGRQQSSRPRFRHNIHPGRQQNIQQLMNSHATLVHQQSRFKLQQGIPSICLK